MIFKILKIRQMVKEGTENPSEFAGGQASDFIVGLLIAPLVIAIAVLVLLFILSYTTLLGGPFGFAKFFFYVVLFGALAFGSLVWKLSKLTKQMTRSAVDKTISVTAKVIE